MNKKPIQESYAHLTSPFHQQWAAETGKEKFASETPGGSRVTLAPPSSAACPPEGKQREPEIASLPAVRQEATSPTTESAHAIDSESCPVIHLQRLAASHPPSWGGEAGRGSARVCAPWSPPKEGRVNGASVPGQEVSSSYPLPLPRRNSPLWLCHLRPRGSAGFTPQAVEWIDISGAIKCA